MAASIPRSASVWDYRNPSSYNEDDSDLDSEEEEHYYQFIVSEVLRNHVPETWTEVGEMDDEVRLVNLTRNCKEFSDVVSRIRMTLKIDVDRIQRVQNPYLWGQYLVKRKEYKKRLKNSLKEMNLFHATGEQNVQSIAEDNFDWRLTKRNKFGKGVSFSPFADYADKYCNSKAGNKRALILTRVLVGRTHKGCPKYKIPKEGFDTTTGNKGSVYVNYFDHEFYPEYVAYYSKQNS